MFFIKVFWVLVTVFNAMAALFCLTGVVFRFDWSGVFYTLFFLVGTFCSYRSFRIFDRKKF